MSIVINTKTYSDSVEVLFLEGQVIDEGFYMVIVNSYASSSLLFRSWYDAKI